MFIRNVANIINGIIGLTGSNIVTNINDIWSNMVINPNINTQQHGMFETLIYHGFCGGIVIDQLTYGPWHMHFFLQKDAEQSQAVASGNSVACREKPALK
jgi:hypothetical protein